MEIDLSRIIERRLSRRAPFAATMRIRRLFFSTALFLAMIYTLFSIGCFKRSQTEIESREEARALHRPTLRL